MSRFVSVCMVLCFVLASASLFAQVNEQQVDITYFGYKFYDFDFVGAGARAEGMGKAHLGVADDVNGAGWNPAGLFLIEKPVIGASWPRLCVSKDTRLLARSA